MINMIKHVNSLCSPARILKYNKIDTPLHWRYVALAKKKPTFRICLVKKPMYGHGKKKINTITLNISEICSSGIVRLNSKTASGR